tara:strand:+ start:91 stop:2388 length:2298 start_codon:yes stop_codon:yes gene_type:complete
MREILKDLPAVFPSYFDDVFTSGDSPSEFISNVKALLEVFKDKNVKVSLSKVLVGSNKIDALGYEIDKNGYKPKEELLNKAKEQEFPNIKNIRSYLGLVNVFSPFLKDLPELIAPFREVRKKNAQWIVTDEMKSAHNKIKEAIANIPSLHFCDPAKQLYIECDASEFGSGAILYQLDDKGEKEIIRITSTTFAPAAMKWSTIQKEAFAIMKAMLAFETIIDGKNIKILTDHRNLVWMSKVSNKMVSRWYDYLSLFDVDIIHIPGLKNIYADALSRLGLHINPQTPNTVSVLIDAAGGADSGKNQDDEDPADEESFKDLFDQIHNSIMGHFGVDYTLQSMKDAGAEPRNLRQRVIELISKCAVCIKSRKRLSKVIRERHSITASTPFAIFEMDFVSGLPTSRSGNDQLLIVMDSFTRFAYVYPCSGATSDNAKRALLQVYSYFGVPTRLRTDGGSAFIAKGFKDFCDAIKLKHNTTVPHHSEAHGQVEVMNREALKHFRNALQDNAKYDANNWDESAPLVASILNNKVHASTGYSPFNLLFGSEHALRHSSNDLADLDRSNADEYIRKLDDSLRIAHKYAQESQDFLTISNYDKFPKVEEEFFAGDFVLIPNRIGDRLKLSMPMAGPYKIEAVTASKDIFRLRDITQDRYSYAHACTFVPFPYRATEEELRKISASDYGEYAFTILDHIGDPQSKKTIFVQVQWDDKQQSVSWIPLSACTLTDAARKYFAKVPGFQSVCTAADLAPKSTVRLRAQSQLLNDYDTSR